MEAAIRLRNVTKHYDKFTLDHITLDIPRGSIVGLVGENGAGKTTLLKTILQMIHMDEGEIIIEDTPLRQLPGDWKEDVGVIMTGLDFMAGMTASDIGKCMRSIYKNWNSQTYEKYLKDFKLDRKKQIKEYSKGMKMKLNLALALSHNARILIFDEATSGLDPVVRDDILELLLDFIQDENHTVLVSSHIISDLEKVADYIAFLHEGQMQFCMNKDELLYDYAVVRCSEEDYRKIPGSYVKRVRKNGYGCEVLISGRDRFEAEMPGYVIDKVTIENIILFWVKGERS